MNKAKKIYKSKIKRRSIDFYLYENDLFEFTKKINFQALVKGYLKAKMLEERKAGK